MREPWRSTSGPFRERRREALPTTLRWNIRWLIRSERAVESLTAALDSETQPVSIVAPPATS